MEKEKGKRKKVKGETRGGYLVGQRGRWAAVVLLLPFTFYLLPVTLAEACPGCKEALFDPSRLQEKLSVARGYALSIGLLLAVPLGLVIGIALLIVRAQRRQAPRTSPHERSY